MQHKKNISETAYLIATCKANKPLISKDVFADFFLDEKAKIFRDVYLKEVSSKEDIAISLRNRFFLEEIKSFFDKNKKGVFVNLGSGFSTYSFLLSKKISCIEIDAPNIIAVKNEQIKKLMKKNLLPKRNISFFPIDFNKEEDLENLEKFLAKKLDNKKSFILLEGLTYYLREERIFQLFKILNKIQVKGSLIGLDIWTPEIEKSNTYKKFKSFIKKHLENVNKHFTLIDETKIKSIQGYIPLIHTNHEKLSNKFRIKEKIVMKDDIIIKEGMFILKKI